MRLDHRLASAIVLVAWAAFFCWLKLSGEQSRYLGQRTYWVVIFGAVTLTIAALASVVAVRAHRHGRPVRKAELVGLFIVLFPILAVAAVPSPKLGAYAASHRLGSATLDMEATRGSVSGDKGFAQLAVSNLGAEQRQKFGIVPGVDVKFAGVLTKIDGAPALMELTRFYVTCCAADAVAFKVHVLKPKDLPGSLAIPNTWLGIVGKIAEQDGQLVVEPTFIEELDEPQSPYLNF
jgi:uncharacterized repeat protein (TIGR03943 family)